MDHPVILVEGYCYWQSEKLSIPICHIFSTLENFRCWMMINNIWKKYVRVVNDDIKINNFNFITKNKIWDISIFKIINNKKFIENIKNIKIGTVYHVGEAQIYCLIGTESKIKSYEDTYLNSDEGDTIEIKTPQIDSVKGTKELNFDEKLILHNVDAYFISNNPIAVNSISESCPDEDHLEGYFVDSWG